MCRGKGEVQWVASRLFILASRAPYFCMVRSFLVNFCHGTVQTAGTQVLGASGGQPDVSGPMREQAGAGPTGNRTDGRADSRPGERPGKGTGG